MTEKQVIQGCKNNEHKAQKELVYSYSGYLFTIARRYMTDQSSAEDVLQQSLTKILKYIHQFNSDKGSLKSWMSRITINEAIRNQSKYRSSNIDIDEMTSAPPTDPVALSKLNAEDMVKLIQSLPHQYQNVFNMYAVDGFSHKEIAKKLNISPSTSRSNLVRARQCLKRLLKEQENKQQWKKIS